MSVLPEKQHRIRCIAYLLPHFSAFLLRETSVSMHLQRILAIFPLIFYEEIKVQGGNRNKSEDKGEQQML